MKKLAFCFVMLMLISGVVSAQDDLEAAFLNSFHAISSNDIRDYVVELTSEKFDGRLAGSPEFIATAEWVAENLKEWGLKPMGDEGSYFQWFDWPYTDVKNAGSLELHGSNGKKVYTFPENFYPGSNSGSGTITAEVVYVGHGITAPELGYNDYADVDVKGKIVILETGIPVGSDDPDFIKWVPYSYHVEKLENAVKQGAAGVLYASLVANPGTPYNENLIYCHIDQTVVDDLFAGSGKVHKDIKAQIAETLKPVSMGIDKKVTISASTVHHPEGKCMNVLGLIEGSDPVLKNEVIIIGGHLDHVGSPGALFPGAWDNASGSANMLAAAKALASSPVKLKRSILFIFIGGEEVGLIGAKLYCQEPKIPFENTVCYFNLDMVGVGSGISVSSAKSYPLILDCFVSANDKYIHRPFRSSEARPLGIGRPRSDSSIFKKAGLKTLGFSTFRQPGEVRTPAYYHHPLDTVETLSPETMEDVVKLMFLGLTNMANAEKLFD